ncbi:hypothetical protein QE612_11335 [Streptococcus suis]|uniref:Uncharacterized protein n=1 Tax=Streptococcus suis TaxID=1307 RepID=A0A116LKY6_STRSU|nr:hypothetical protein [Streptococcus suis]MBY4961354.1 hypothetical protein [Streptococcus suis]MBY4967678.1 hypothetical protein [Streptococcus suis]MBY4975242.1 hypothetical protein [Streptococcus suis]MBY4978754.1 hypothetical protein [Streptococcus suis]MBY4982793.1 hypothetical protein [Streptococcus suis]
MAKIDTQMVILHKVQDDSDVRQYSVETGDSYGIATYDKVSKTYAYSGDDIDKFADFVKNTLTNSVLKNKMLPNKIVHGFG